MSVRFNVICPSCSDTDVLPKNHEWEICEKCCHNFQAAFQLYEDLLKHSSRREIAMEFGEAFEKVTSYILKLADPQLQAEREAIIKDILSHNKK